MHRMRTATLACCLLLSSPLAVCSSPSTAQEPSVQLLRADDDRLWYINRTTLVRLPKQISSFWSRIVPRKGGETFRQQQTVLARAGRDPRRLEFIQRLDEMDCSRSRIRSLGVLYYDEKGRILLSRMTPRADWSDITAGSEDSFVRDAVCTDNDAAIDIASAVLPHAAEGENSGIDLRNSRIYR